MTGNGERNGLILKVKHQGRIRSLFGGRDRDRYSPLRGASAALVSRGGSRVLGLLFLVLLAREQSTRAFASYNYLLVLAATVSVVTDAGVALVAGRDVAHGDLGVGVAFRAAALAHLGTTLLATAGVIVLGLVAPGPGVSSAAVLWTGGFIFLNGVFNLQTELLRGAGQPWIEAMLQMAAATVQVALGIWVVLEGYGVAALMAVLAAKQLLAVLLAQAWLPLPWRAEPRPGLWRQFLKRGVLLGAAGAVGTVATRSPQIVLGSAGSPTELSRFAVASRYLDLITIGAVTLGFGLLPAMSNRMRRGVPAFTRFTRRILLICVGATAAVAIPVVILAPWLTATVFGGRYRAAGPSAQLFVVAAPVIMAMFVAQYNLVAARRERAVLLANVAGLAVAAAGAVWVIERHSTISAAEVVVVAFTVPALILTYQAIRGPAGGRGAAAALTEQPAVAAHSNELDLDAEDVTDLGR